MSHQDDLRDEFLMHREFLDQPRGADFSSQLVAMQTEQRLEEINQELFESQIPHLDIRMAGLLTERKSIPASLLTLVVNRLQSVFTWTAWAERFGPAVAGTPPASVERLAAADFYALAPTSFRFGLRPSTAPPDSAQESMNLGVGSWAGAAESVVAVLKAAERDSYDDGVAETLQTMGRGATRRLQLLAKTFADSASVVQIDWVSGEDRTHVELSPERSASFATWLSEFEETLDDYDVTGVLRVLDTVRGRFGIEDAATGRIHEGKAASELLTGAEVNRGVYIARIQARIREVGPTGAATERLTLASLTREADPEHDPVIHEDAGHDGTLSDADPDA